MNYRRTRGRLINITSHTGRSDDALVFNNLARSSFYKQVCHNVSSFALRRRPAFIILSHYLINHSSAMCLCIYLSVSEETHISNRRLKCLSLAPSLFTECQCSFQWSFLYACNSEGKTLPVQIVERLSQAQGSSSSNLSGQFGKVKSQKLERKKEKKKRSSKVGF